MKANYYLCTQLAGRLVSITQSILGVASIGTGAGGSTSFQLKRERNSLQAIPFVVKRFLLLLLEEMKHFTFSEIDFLALAREVTAKTLPFFGLSLAHSLKAVSGETFRALTDHGLSLSLTAPTVRLILLIPAPVRLKSLFPYMISIPYELDGQDVLCPQGNYIFLKSLHIYEKFFFLH